MSFFNSHFKPASRVGFGEITARSKDPGAQPPWRRIWSSMASISPEQIKQVMAEEMEPMRAEILLNMNDRVAEGGLYFSVYSRDTRQRIASMDAEFFATPHQNVFRLDEIRIEDPANRGHGTGQKMVNAVMKFCNTLGVKKIELRAGRENGPSFWTHQGFQLENVGRLGENFARGVWENFEKLPPETQDVFRADLERILEDVSPMANQEILALDPDDIGRKLLTNTNPRMFFELDH